MDHPAIVIATKLVRVPEMGTLRRRMEVLRHRYTWNPDRVEAMCETLAGKQVTVHTVGVLYDEFLRQEGYGWFNGSSEAWCALFETVRAFVDDPEAFEAYVKWMPRAFALGSIAFRHDLEGMGEVLGELGSSEAGNLKEPLKKVCDCARRNGVSHEDLDVLEEEVNLLDWYENHSGFGVDEVLCGLAPWFPASIVCLETEELMEPRCERVRLALAKYGRLHDTSFI